MEKEMICIVCPVGCHLKINIDNETNEIQVSNNKCNRGPEYAKRELSNPTRTVCSTVKIVGGTHPLLPVKTQEEVPKHMNFDVIKELKKIEAKAPIKMGDVIVENICNLGINIIATRDIDAI